MIVIDCYGLIILVNSLGVMIWISPSLTLKSRTFLLTMWVHPTAQADWYKIASSGSFQRNVNASLMICPSRGATSKSWRRSSSIACVVTELEFLLIRNARNNQEQSFSINNNHFQSITIIFNHKILVQLLPCSLYPPPSSSFNLQLFNSSTFLLFLSWNWLFPFLAYLSIVQAVRTIRSLRNYARFNCVTAFMFQYRD